MGMIKFCRPDGRSFESPCFACSGFGCVTRGRSSDQLNWLRTNKTSPAAVILVYAKS